MAEITVQKNPAPGVQEWALQYESDGAPVPARVLAPAAAQAAPAPVVIVQHGLNGAKDAPYMNAAVLPWVRAGLAVACMDFPLHGARAGAADATADAPAAADFQGQAALRFARQAVRDLHRLPRALDAAALPALDCTRMAYAGFSLGAILGAPFCAQEARICAAALALGGAGLGPAETDPARWIGRFAPRPLLFLQALRDQRIPRAAALALHAAARQPKRALWFDCTHANLPGAALKAMLHFLQGALAP